MKDLVQNLLRITAIQRTHINSGATYRPADDSFPMSCQYWQPPDLNYMSSGDSPYVTGVGSALWNSSRSCGQCLEVESWYTKIPVVIADYCPPPCTPHQLDLSPAASAKLNPSKKPINYQQLKIRKAECKWQRYKEIFYLDKGSSQYTWYIIPLFIKEPFTFLKIHKSLAYHDKYGRWVVPFNKTHPAPPCDRCLLIKTNQKAFTVDYPCRLANRNLEKVFLFSENV